MILKAPITPPSVNNELQTGMVIKPAPLAVVLSPDPPSPLTSIPAGPPDDDVWL